MVDRTRLSPVEEVVEKFETSLSEQSKSASRISDLVLTDLGNRRSVAESVALFESPQRSGLNSPSDRVSPIRNSSGSEFQLSKGVTSDDAANVRPLSDIERDLEASGVPEEKWAKPIVPRPRPRLSIHNVGSNRHGRVLSTEEKNLLQKMILEGEVEDTRAEDVLPKAQQPASGGSGNSKSKVEKNDEEPNVKPSGEEPATKAEDLPAKGEVPFPTPIP
jgi:hypothetical protein